MRREAVLLGILAMTSMILSFQNCGSGFQIGAHDTSLSSLSAASKRMSVVSGGSGFMSGMLSAGKGAIIRVAVDESKLPAGAHLFWDNIYSDGMLYCEQTMAINQLSVDFQCPYDGVVTLSLSVFREGSEIPEVESLMVVVGLPGSITVPNPGDDSAIDPPAVDPISMTPGQVLYLNNCRDCHGDLAVSRKRGSTRARLDTAINSVAAMRTLATLTSQERDLIIQALGQ